LPVSFLALGGGKFPPCGLLLFHPLVSDLLFSFFKYFWKLASGQTDLPEASNS
jgi:hypothetical protein